MLYNLSCSKHLDSLNEKNDPPKDSMNVKTACSEVRCFRSFFRFLNATIQKTDQIKLTFHENKYEPEFVQKQDNFNEKNNKVEIISNINIKEPNSEDFLKFSNFENDKIYSFSNYDVIENKRFNLSQFCLNNMFAKKDKILSKDTDMNNSIIEI